MSVNCETQSISPSISFTLAFHIWFVTGSSKTRKDRLRGYQPGRKRDLCNRHFLRQRGNISVGIIYSKRRASREMEQKGCKDTEPIPIPTRTKSPFPIFEITSLSTGVYNQQASLEASTAPTCNRSRRHALYDSSHKNQKSGKKNLEW